MFLNACQGDYTPLLVVFVKYSRPGSLPQPEDEDPFTKNSQRAVMYRVTLEACQRILAGRLLPVNIHKKLDSTQKAMYNKRNERRWCVMNECRRCTGSLVISHTFQLRGSRH